MKLRKDLNNNFKIEALNIDSANYSSGFLIDNLFNVTNQDVINPINDYEVSEFNFIENSLEFNIYFYREYNDDDDITESVTKNYQQYKNVINNELKDIKKNKLASDVINLSPQQVINSSEGVVRNTPISLNQVYPTISGTPHFYNTFSFPFFSSADNWSQKRHKFNNEQYLYNSFILLEFYDSPVITNRKKVFSTVLHPNPRYTKTIVLNDTPWSTFNLLTPSFLLDETCESFTLNWVNDNLTEFYVQPYFWNALTGEQIPLVPTSEKTKQHQWVQSQDNFNYRNMFLKYTLDAITKTYTISLFDDVIGDWVFDVSKVDFYQLVFDEYWSRNKPEINLTPDINATVILNNTFDFEVSKDVISNTITTTNPVENVYNTSLFLENTGTGDLKLDDVFVYWVSPDQRIISDRVNISQWNNSSRSYTRNFYTFIQNQQDYAGFNSTLRRNYPQYFPISQTNADDKLYQDLFGELFQIRLATDRQKLIKKGDRVSVLINQKIGSEYVDAYIPKPVTHFVPVNLNGQRNVRTITYPFKMYYKIDFMMSDINGDNQITRTINYQLNYNIKV